MRVRFPLPAQILEYQQQQISDKISISNGILNGLIKSKIAYSKVTFTILINFGFYKKKLVCLCKDKEERQ